MNDIEKIILGAVIAITGGIVGKVFSVLFDEWRERKYIKQNLKDELEKIISIIDKLIETNEKSNQIHPSYLADLLANTECYRYHRNRLFLLSDDQPRKDIISFYGDLQKYVAENEGIVGTLNANDTTQQNKITENFRTKKQIATSIIAIL